MAQQKEDKKAPVNQFMIYDVCIEETQQTHAFEKMPRHMAIQNAASIFGSCFDGRSLNIFRAQRDLPGGKKTMKSYLWKLEGETYDAAHPRV